MRTIAALPPELTELLFDAGNRIIVLVEGEDDRDALREWFSEHRPEIEFYDCGGAAHLEPLLNELLKHSTLKRAYAISDRDFRTEVEVAASYAPGSHLFILRRYALENYLLEPRPVWQVLTLRHPEKLTRWPNEQAMADRLLELCQMLKSLMAANWLFYEENRAQYLASGVTKKLEYFSIGYDPLRLTVVQESARQLGCTDADAEARIAMKEQVLDQQLSQLETAHQVIDGKRLLHWVQREEFKTGEDYLRRLLVRENRHCGIHTDLTALVIDRILPTA